MAQTERVTLLGALAGAAYAGYGVFTNGGAVGWANALQQRLFGAYRPLVSFVLVLALVMLATRLAWVGLARLFRPASAGDSSTRDFLVAPGAPQHPGAAPAAPPTAGPRRQGPALLRISLILLPLTWLVGYGVYEWLARGAREDAAATYQPIDLTDGAPLPALTGRHLALRAIPVTEAVVAHTTSGGVSASPDYQLVPVVGIGWRPERPVQFVVKVRRSEVLPSPVYPPDPKARNPREVVLFAKTAGPVPEVAAGEFAKLKVPLAPAAKLLQLVPTMKGRPAMEDQAINLISTVGLCGIVSVMLLVMPVVGYREDRRRRTRG